MAAVDDTNDHDDAPVGEVPEGLDSGLYARHLESMSRDEAFGEAVLSFRDSDGHEQEIPIEDVAGTEPDGEGRNRTKILLRNGAIVVVTGAVIAGAIAAARYRRRHKQ
jgi:hypothetical protein